jgi:homoserine O-acetyltransferase/O-succinyltransferase
LSAVRFEPGSVGVVETRFVDLPDPLPLESGRELRDVRIAYETYGELSPDRDNVVLVCHALSGDAHAAGWSTAEDVPTALDGIGADERGVRPRGGLGWWDGMIGPGKPFDTDRYHVVCPNLLGGCRGTTGPSSINPDTGEPYGPDFPVVTVGDMIRAQRRLLDELGLERVLCVTGASLGGMQALQWTVDYPDDIDLCLAIASTARLDTQGLALNAIARNAITSDPDWQGGRYYGTGREPRAGLALARQVGHVTYLSKHSLAEKFGRRLQDRDEPSFTWTEADFAVESYLRHQGGRFVERFDANTYLAMSRALTYFDLARTHGAGSLERALAPARASFTLLSFSSDWIYPPADAEELLAALETAGKDAEHVLINTNYGHDSFLLEEEAQAPHIVAALERARTRRRTHA